MALANPNFKGTQDFRVGGAGFTVFHFSGQAIAYAQAISSQSPQAVAAPVAIQPMDSPRPIQIVTTIGITGGTVTLQMYETFNAKVWDQIMGILDGANTNTTNAKGVYNDLSDILLRMASIGKGISATKLVTPPRPIGPNKIGFVTDTMHNVTITDVRDDEQINVGTVELTKPITLQYTHATRSYAVK
jgi:hypothetical protein